MNQQNTNSSAHQLVRSDLDTAGTSIGRLESALGTSDIEHGDRTSVNNTDNVGNTYDVANTDDAQTDDQVKKKTRRIANQYLLGKRYLFMQHTHINTITDASTVMIGKVKGCPNKRNNNQYRIEWDTSHRANIYMVNIYPCTKYT
mmetsp:Transcript_13851/g.26079  ORF Transcript_13851/g.26079 Transcript_13851/m.26079 type:complete len:145 (-) Transcript_13851:41-475(-)